MNPSLLCPSLLKWLSTFEGCGHVTTARDIDSGVIVARVLHQIEPACFSADWLERINTDVGDNWRLKVRNLKKVAQSIVDYFSDNLELSIGLLKQPELTRLAEQGNVEEATRLIQLVLGVAINCSRKQEFIEAIRLLEPGVQTALMTAIQELMTSTLSTAAAGGGSGQLDSCSSWLGEVSRLTQELQLVRDERDTLSQRCFQQERQLQELHDEKMATAGELQSLQARAVKAAALPPSAPTEPVCDTQLPSSGDRYKQLRVKLDAAQDEIYRLETSRDELKSKFEERDRQLKESQSRLDELQKLAEESRTIKDELDILRERSIKVSQYESTLETYKRRLQEMHDLRAQIKTLELKNAEYVQLNEELEEEVKKSGCYRPQLDIYKQRVTELLEQLTEETGKLDVAEFERRKLTDRLDTIQLERDRVVEDRERLKETIEELRLSQLAQQQASSSTTTTTTAAATTAAGQGAGEGSGLTQPSTLDALPHVSPEIRDRLLKLQHENRLLRLRAAGPSDVHETAIDSAYRQLASDFNQREATHLADIRRYKQRVVELESALTVRVVSNDVTDSGSQSEASSHGARLFKLEQELQSKTMQIGEMEIQANEQSSRCRDLQDQLAKREAEMAAMEERYKKYLEKAKAVVRSLDPKNRSIGGASIDTGVLKHQLAEKEKMVEMLQKENEKAKSVRETEEKLICSAFHNLGLQMHRRAMEQRLDTASSPHSSFLTQQRQASMRRHHGNSHFYDY